MKEGSGLLDDLRFHKLVGSVSWGQGSLGPHEEGVVCAAWPWPCQSARLPRRAAAVPRSCSWGRSSVTACGSGSPEEAQATLVKQMLLCLYAFICY